MFLEPDESIDELAALNPGVPEKGRGVRPFLYRSIRKNDVPELLEMGSERSVIMLRSLFTPTVISEKKEILIAPEHDYEIMGCEDPRITHFNQRYWIAYTAFDGINARVAIATARGDMGGLQKHGTIGPEIPLAEAIRIVGNDRYKKVWKEQLDGAADKRSKLKLDTEIYVYNKDAALEYKKGLGFIFYFRLDPDMHAVVVPSLRVLKDQNFWREVLKNIDNHVFLRGEEAWCSKKVGYGDAPHAGMNLYHGVQKVNGKLVYSGSWYEIDPSNPTKPSRVMREPMFRPEGKLCRFDEQAWNGDVNVKLVKFPTAQLVEGDTHHVYAGAADKLIIYMTATRAEIESRMGPKVEVRRETTRETPSLMHAQRAS